MILKATPVPKLRAGDRLSADEFRRRYEAMPPGTRAELIDGEVFMPSPVSWEFHGGPHADVCGWLAQYKAFTPGTDAGDNATVRLDDDNEPQPDLSLLIRPEFGGQIELDADGYVVGSPELVVEVSASSVGIDRNRKFEMYGRFAVREYIILRTEDEELDWFIRRGRRFVPLTPDKTDGLLKSETFPGLWLDAAALVRRDLAAVLTALTHGVRSAEHAKFVKRLASRRRT
jgi:Uma2 family endonuclease